jgi:CubicO group peptidase (beta-lactamase class C family)
MTSAAVSGSVSPGFEPVRELLEARQSEIGRGGVAVCATLNGSEVVDLWVGQSTPEEPWQQDTVSALFSATKGLTALCALLLHDRGLLDVDAPMEEYWPGFAAPVTVRQVLSHSSGLTEIPAYQEFMSPDGTGFGDLAEIRRRLAGSSPQWTPGTQHGYHGLTFGYLVGGLVEEITGMPLAEFFRKEVAEPLGLELFLGVDDALLARKSQLIEPDPLPPEFQVIADMLLGPCRDEHEIAGRAFLAQGGVGVLDRLAELANAPELLNCGGGFGDAIGTARALAHFYRELISGLVSQDALSRFSTIQIQGPDTVLTLPTAYCLGFQGNIMDPTGQMIFGPGPNTFGHGGAGGQIGIVDPDAGITFGFVRSHLALVSTLGRDLIQAVYAAATS